MKISRDLSLEYDKTVHKKNVVSALLLLLSDDAFFAPRVDVVVVVVFAFVSESSALFLFCLEVASSTSF